jgi:hypothetical protein
MAAETTDPAPPSPPPPVAPAAAPSRPVRTVNCILGDGIHNSEFWSVLGKSLGPSWLVLMLCLGVLVLRLQRLSGFEQLDGRVKVVQRARRQQVLLCSSRWRLGLILVLVLCCRSWPCHRRSCWRGSRSWNRCVWIVQRNADQGSCNWLASKRVQRVDTWIWEFVASMTRCWWDAIGWPLFQEVQNWRSNVETQVKTCQNVSSALSFFPHLEILESRMLLVVMNILPDQNGEISDIQCR